MYYGYMTCRNYSRLFKHRLGPDGFTLIETLVAIGLLGIFFSAVTVILQFVVESIGSSRVRSTALSLGEQKMEAIRNLPYASAGTAGGIPAGAVPPAETVLVNGLNFTVTTSIIYIDDPYDGLAPADTVNTDYKRARVEISWGGSFPSRVPLVLVTNITPKTKETETGGGTLSFRVYNSYGLPVSGTTVKIDNTAVSPAIHMESLTDSDGSLVIPGSPACAACYRVSATKSPDYSTDRTYSTAEVTNPVLPDQTVINGSLTQLSLSIDRVSYINFIAYTQNYLPASNVQFTLRGSKIIGYDEYDEPVYKNKYRTTTIGNTVSIPSIEWDIYTLDLSDSAHTLAGSNPVVPFSVNAGTSLNVAMVVVPKTLASLLVITENALKELQASASARLTGLDLSYDQTRYTPSTGSADFGQAFFINLTPGSYGLSVNLAGYSEATAAVTVSTNQSRNMFLTPL